MTTSSTSPETPSESHSSLIPPAIQHPFGILVALGLSAFLMVTAFPDGDQDYLVWLTMIPFFLTLRGAGGKKGFFYGWLGGALIEGFGFWWIGFAINSFSQLGFFIASLFFLAWLAFSALSWGILGLLLGKCRKPIHIHAVILIWVGIEFYFPRLFPWHFGGVFYQREWLSQAADIFGASGLSYVVLLGNASLYLLWEWKKGKSAFPKITVTSVVLLILFLNVYGFFRVENLNQQIAEAPEVSAGVIQPMARPEVKHASDSPGRVKFALDHLNRTQALIKNGAQDLVVWIEGAYPLVAFHPVSGEDPLKHIRRLDQRLSFDPITVPLVVGGSSYLPNPQNRKRDQAWNSAAFIEPKAFLGAGTNSADDLETRASLYHKRKRLLFGEMLPLQDYYPDWILDRVQVGTLQAGEDNPTFTLPLKSQSGESGEASAKFKILICYEAVLPSYFRHQLGDSDFLVNITEDIWYGQTAHIRQHESVLRMRCIENRVPLIRCTNVGPSGVVEITGAFDQRTAVWKAEDKVVKLKAVRAYSFYSSLGHHFSWLVIVVGFVLFIKRNSLTSPKR